MPDSKLSPPTPEALQPSSAKTSARPGPRRKAWMIAVCSLVVLTLALFFYHRATTQSRAKTPTPPPLAVSTAVARKGNISVYVNALGAVTPIYTVMVRSRVDGQIMSVGYQEGQMVHTNDPLVEIDPRPYAAQLAQAKGQLARDSALLENAHVDLDRYQSAYSQNAIPKQQLDTQRATVHQYEGAIQLDQGQVDTAQLQLVYCHITAPIAGRVGLRLVDPGNIVHVTDSNPLAIITQLQPITVLFSVAEDDLPQIQQQLRRRQDLPVDAFDRSLQHRLASGTLLTLDNLIDTNTGTIKIKALFTNDDSSLFPNQFVNARLRLEEKQGVTLVPTSVVQRGAQGSFVYVVNPNQTVAMHPVTVGPTDGNDTAVEGLEPGAVLVADNFNRVQEGARVVSRAPPDNTQSHGGSTGPPAHARSGGSM